MTDSFVHLHQHTEYSMLDGASRVGEVVAAAAADGQPALGITDHGNMYGVLDFYRECENQGITPVLGFEAYMAHESRAERPSRRGRLDDGGGDTEGGRKLYYHLTLLAENGAGYRNLIQLSSLAFLEGYYYKPRLDWELLETYSEGVIATTGCLGGHVLQALMNQGFDAALERAGRLQDIFGRDNLFVELQDHGLRAQHDTNPGLIEIAKKLGAPLLATNDSHYVTAADAEAHDALLCVQTGSLMSDENRFRFESNNHYLKSATEMRHLFRELPAACDNTLWIAERSKVDIEFGKPQLPDFPIPASFATAREYLRHLTYEGALRRWGDDLDPTVTARLEHELGTIADMGFDSYFLITWDLIRHARDMGIRVGPGRGSAAGCAVAYCLWITDLDPIKYGLIFERFLNPSRISMPDIDMDFDSRFRDEMIRYAAEKYGRDHVAQIVTFSTIKARAAVRDAARVLGLPYGLGDKVAKAMPPLIMGRDTPLAACLEENPKYVDGFKQAAELRQMYEADPDARKVIDVAKGLEGLRRQDGIHAAAVVITRDPLTTYLPIQRKPDSSQAVELAPVVTQYEMNNVEALGLLKMDFLGLRNLDVITDAVRVIKDVRGIELDIDRVELDDERTYEMLRRGESIGVFQLESAPMRTLMRSLAPTSFEDIAALVALYRPGPMAANMHNDYADYKNGRKEIQFFHPEAEELLADTYGLMIYQESVMNVATKFAGYSLAQADNLRKACGKKKPEVMAKEKAGFVEGCEASGYGRKLGETLFGQIEKFADYAFNKSHSFGYGLVSYQTAYLKANYPAEYFSALLTSVRNNLDKAAVYLAECRSMGLEVLVPDINRSVADFMPATESRTEDGHEQIYFGLAAVRNVGQGLVEQILTERAANGPFEGFDDFVARVPYDVLNKRTVESLIKAGAFDGFERHPRRGLLDVMEERIDHIVARRREFDMGVMSLFGESSDRPSFDSVVVPDREFAKKARLSFEKEMLGLYVSDHPLKGLETVVAQKADFGLADLEEVEDGANVTLGGVIANLQRRYTRKSELMASFELEDLSSSIEVMVFPKTMTNLQHLLSDDAVVLVTGRIDRRDDTPKLIARSVSILEIDSDDGAVPLHIRIEPARLSDEVLGNLREVLREFPGSSPVVLDVDPGPAIRLADTDRVDPSAGLLAEIRILLGAGAIAQQPAGLR